MARYAYNNTTVDQNGKILGGATVSLYLAGTTTPAKMYAASAGGTAVYSMLSSNVNGSFTFYVDDGDYAIGQLFDITTTKANYVPVTFSSVHIYNPTSTITIDTDVTLAGDSNLVVASQHATKTYVDTGLAGKISHSLATAANDFLVASGAGVFVKNTLAQVKALLAGASAGDLIAWASGPKYPAGDGSLLTGIVNIPRSYLAGLALANNGTRKIDIAAGLAQDSTNTYGMTISSTFTKDLNSSWAVGTGNGGLFFGSIGTSTWYHVFLIRKTSDGSIDAGFDTSVTAANIPAGYGAYRRIGSVLTDGSSNILAFVQTGDYFEWTTHIQDLSSTHGSTNAVTRTLSTPLGSSVLAKIIIFTTGAGVNYTYMSSLATTDSVATSDTAQMIMVAGGANSLELNVMTNTSSQIRSRGDTAATTFKIITEGYYDYRGRND